MNIKLKTFLRTVWQIIKNTSMDSTNVQTLLEDECQLASSSMKFQTTNQVCRRIRNQLLMKIKKIVKKIIKITIVMCAIDNLKIKLVLQFIWRNNITGIPTIQITQIMLNRAQNDSKVIVSTLSGKLSVAHQTLFETRTAKCVTNIPTYYRHQHRCWSVA